MKKKHLRKSKQKREARGVYVVELLIALALGALLAFSLLSTLSESMRQVTSTQNQTTAHLVMNELLEWSRATGFNYLSSYMGTSEIRINRSIANEPGSDTNIRNEVLMLDDFSENWSEAAEAGKFNGKAFCLIEPGPDANSLRVTITIEWKDSTSFGANSESSIGTGRQLVNSTVIRRFGTGAYSL